MTGWNRHWKRKIICVFLGSLLVSGCGKVSRDIMENQVEREKLLMWSYFETEAQQKGLDELTDNFNHSQSRYEISWEYVPMTEFTKKLSIGMTEEELPDMVIIDNPNMKTYINLEMFEDITEELEQLEGVGEYYAETLSSAMKEDRFYGLPMCCNNLGLIYRKDLLEEAGLNPPGNWEELLQCARQLSTEKRYGFAMCALEGEQCAFQVAPWILAEEEENQISLDDEATKIAFKKINTLLQNGYMDRNCVNWSQVDIARKFVNGEVAMMENGPWVFPMLEEAGIDYGIVPLNVGTYNKVLIGGENIGVIKGKNIEGASAFLRYYNQDKVMSDFCKTANVLPPKKSLALDACTYDPKLQVFAEQMNTAIARNSFPQWEQLSTDISEAAYELFTGQVKLEEKGMEEEREPENAGIGKDME